MAEPGTPLPATPRPRPVFARHAASLLVVRDGPNGPAVLMGVRGKGHRFMPNRLVFPGGAVDRGDATAPAAAEPSPALLAVLTRQARPPLARGLVLCAARELEEETGLTLGTPPALDRLRYLCRAVTPPDMPIRFNARFLVVSADAVNGEFGDSDELSAVGFRDVAAALSGSASKELAPVTREVLLQFAAWHRAGGTDAAERLVFRKQSWVRDR